MVSGAAQAAPFVTQATLRGSEEVPPNGSTATGFSTATLRDDNVTLDVSLTFSGLTAPANGAHIHCCAPPGVNAPVAVDFAGLFPTATSGGFSTTTFNLNTAFTAAFITARGGQSAALAAFVSNFRSGNTYVNVHNSVFPGGEIRGQLFEVPEPGAAAVLGLALLGLAGVRRGRRFG
jgi:hypothetical protein